MPTLLVKKIPHWIYLCIIHNIQILGQENNFRFTWDRILDSNMLRWYPYQPSVQNKDPTGKALRRYRHARGLIKHGSTVPFPQPRLRSRSPGLTATCWCFWPHPATLPLHPSYWPDTDTHIRAINHTTWFENNTFKSIKTWSINFSNIPKLIDILVFPLVVVLRSLRGQIPYVWSTKLWTHSKWMLISFKCSRSFQ